MIRRKNFEGENEIIFDKIKINLNSQEVFVCNKPMLLTKREFDLLMYFISNKEKVITKEAIAEHLVGNNADLLDSFDFIYTHIRNLRKKIMDLNGPDYIQTIYSIGYIFSKLNSFYEKTMHLFFRYKYFAFIISFSILIGSYLLYAGLPSGFLPYMDEGTFILDYRTPPGTSLKETNRVLLQVEKIIRETPQVVSYSRRTGLQLGGGITEANSGDFLIRLKKNRSLGIQEVIDSVRKKVLTRVPGIHIEFAQLMGDLIGDLTAVPQPIEIKIFGNNFNELEKLSKKIVAIISNVRGVVDIYNGITIAGSSVLIKVKPLVAGLYGLSAEGIYREIYSAINGDVASEVQNKLFMTGIRVRYPLENRKNVNKIKRIRILSPNGDYVSLSTVADVSILEGQPQITRENLKQMIAVTGRISGRDMGSTLKEIQAKIKKNINLPPSVFIKYGGLYKEQQKSFKGLLIVLVLAILLVFTVQLIEFESFKIPFIIISLSILSLFGVFLLLSITKIGLNISSMMGMIMIIGIVAENAIFLIHYIRLFKNDGFDLQTALIEAGKIRMRPILMTTLAAVLALMPLAIGIGAGAQMQQPLAIAVIGGFSISAILLLFLLPVFYLSAFHK